MPKSTGPVFFGLVAMVFLISLGVTIHFYRSMSGGMEMPGGWTMSMMWMRMPGQSWLGSATMFMSMWTAMMVTMMLPAELPLLLRYRRAWSGQSSAPPASTLLLASGYFLFWVTTGLVLYAVGVTWALATMRWDALSYAMPVLVGTALILAGAYQFSPWKRIGLSHCRAPASCDVLDGSCGRLTGLSQGIRLGVYCGICCVGPTLALLALGVMEPVAMTAIAVVIVAERLLPRPRVLVQVTGIIAIVAGAAMVIKSIG